MEVVAERGYVAATTAQIAERAGVSEMTLFRHFPTKESLVLDDPFDPLMADAVRSRPEEESPMQALTRGIGSAWTQLDPAAVEALRERLKLIHRTRALQGAIERNSGRTRAALAAALMDRGVSEAQAAVAAAAVIAGLSQALLAWSTSDQDDQDELGEVVAAALGVLTDE